MPKPTKSKPPRRAKLSMGEAAQRNTERELKRMARRAKSIRTLTREVDRLKALVTDDLLRLAESVASDRGLALKDASWLEQLRAEHRAQEERIETLEQQLADAVLAEQLGTKRDAAAAAAEGTAEVPTW